MSLYPYNPYGGQTIQTGVSGLTVDAAYAAHMVWGSPVAYSGSAILASTIQGTVAAGTITTGLGTPDYARSLAIVGGTSVAGTLAFTGTDLAGSAITESLATNGTVPVIGTAAFKTVTQVVLPVQLGTTAAFGVSVGVGEKLGLAHKLSANTVTAAALAGVREATAPTVVVNSGTLSLNTIDLNSALTGGSVDAFYFV